MIEKRKHRRRLVQLEVELAYPGGAISRTKTHDLSIGGLFVDAAGVEPPVVGTVLTVSFLSLPQHSGIYSIKARVQRLTGNGIAMTFIDFGLDDLQFIDAFLSSVS